MSDHERECRCDHCQRWLARTAASTVIGILAVGICLSSAIEACLPKADGPPVQVAVTVACDAGLIALAVGGEADLCAEVGELVAALATIDAAKPEAGTSPAPSAAASAAVFPLRHSTPTTAQLRVEIVRQRNARK